MMQPSCMSSLWCWHSNSCSHPSGGTKEMSNPSLVYLHAISLVAQGAVECERTAVEGDTPGLDNLGRVGGVREERPATGTPRRLGDSHRAASALKRSATLSNPPNGPKEGPCYAAALKRWSSLSNRPACHLFGCGRVGARFTSSWTETRACSQPPTPASPAAR